MTTTRKSGADDRYTAAMGNYELLVRGILDLPNKPAIINLQYVPASHMLVPVVLSPFGPAHPIPLIHLAKPPPAHTIYLLSLIP
jgi:hypothetical protein